MRVVDELPDEVFRALLSQKKALTFAPGRGIQAENSDQLDLDYAVWTPPDDNTLDETGVARRHRDNILQTNLTAEGLQKRLLSLYYESREVEEEQGVNVLYIGLGFIKWFEDARSEVERFAPLVLLPVELTREGAKDRFRLKIRDEDLFTNVSLKVWLAEQHSIQLPELPDTDDWVPSQYFEQVRESIKHESRWKVLDSEILLSFFSFSKFLLWRDLDPRNWPSIENLLNHGILRTLLAAHEEQGLPDAPIIPDGGRIDTTFKAADQVCVLDADSSQTVAIQTALAGRNLVIQGPPGTGKSQTIANLIAGAIHQGKSVLFVAEKLVALQVVYDRLKDVNLGPLCFELHSRKAAKQQVLAQLRDAMQAPSPAGTSDILCAQLDKVALELWSHSDRLHLKHEPGGRTPYEIMGSICLLRDKDVAVPDFQLKGAESWTKAQAAEVLEEIAQLAERLKISGIPARHPWRGSTRGPISPLDAQRLNAIATRLSASIDGLDETLRTVWPLVRTQEANDIDTVLFSDLAPIAQALSLADSKPSESIELLCNPRWGRELVALDDTLQVSKHLDRIEKQLVTTFVLAAWSRDWTSERFEIVASGRSLFRFLRSPYRAAIRAYRGLCRAGLPKTYEQRVAALDLLIEGQALRKKHHLLAARFASDLGPIWPDLPSNWERLAALTAWLHATTILEPTLSVRNERLLMWSDSHNNWRNQVVTLSERVYAALQELVTLTELKDKMLVGDSATLTVPICELRRRGVAWKEFPERFNEWPPVRQGLLRLRELITGDFFLRVYQGSVSPDALVDRTQLAIQEQTWTRMCQSDRELAMMDGRILNEKVNQFRNFDRRRIEAAALDVARKHYDAKPTGSVGEMGIIRSEINKIRKLMPVRKLLENAGNAVQLLKPVFLMSPLSVAQYLTPGHLKFDLLVIDEASQVRPADALGAIARSGQIVVVGDAKQLPPTNFFNRMVADGDEISNEEEDNTPTLGAMESILSLCDATLPNRTMLTWHYRSQHPALVAVSNRNFYRNKLLLPPSVISGRGADGLGVVFHRTPSGAYDRGKSATNVLEADIVADAICDFARQNPDKSLGIGTFSVAQRDVIRDRIDDRRRRDPSLEPFFSTSRKYPFFVKNLESIQGDERDVIFISVGYGRDHDGRLIQNFGPIGKDGGERRLNVLITRARERCEVFSPITADDIDVRNGKAGVVVFKEFLQFAEKGYFDIPRPTTKTFDSDFEESVAEFLKQRGYTVDPQVGMAGFFIDLGVLHPSAKGQYMLGIECDGATYHSSRSARDRDRIRQQVLESRGWTIHRIWSTDWFHRRSDQEKRLLDVLTSCESKKPSEPPPPRLLSVEELRVNDEPTFERQKIEPPRRTSVPYEEADFQVSSSLLPHEADPEKLQAAVLKILNTEGPIHEEELARRLTAVWGLARTGSRIDDATRIALKTLLRAGTAVNVGSFWNVNGKDLLKVRDRSNTNSTTLRKPEYLPPEEIALAAIEVLRANVRVEWDDLLAQIARMFGFQRTGPELHAHFSKVVKSQIGKALTRGPDGDVMLTTLT